MSTYGPPPEPDARSHVRAVVDAAVAAVPFVGSSAQILLDDIVRPSYERRLQDWYRELDLVVQEIRHELPSRDLRDMVEGDRFATAVLVASKIALGTHLVAKISILREALISTALRSDISDFLALRLLGLVDELSPEHVTLLKVLACPDEWCALSAGGARTGRAALEEASSLPPDVLGLCLHDLSVRSLAYIDTLNEVSLDGEPRSSFATSLGEDFLHFVSAFE